MELRHLRYFVAVAEELNFRRAAERLQMAQPPLSQRIQDLEREVGLRLLDRSAHGVSLTEAGALLLEHARRTLAEADAATESLRRQADRGVTVLHAGFPPDTNWVVVQTVVERMAEEFPLVTVRLHELPTSLQLDRLRRGRLDVGLVRHPSTVDGLESGPQLEASLGVLTKATHELPAKLRLSHLARSPLVVFQREMAPALYDSMLAVCRYEGYLPSEIRHARHPDLVFGLVLAGVGVNFIERREYLPEGLAWHRLAGSPLKWRTSCVWQPQRHTPVIDAFVDAAGAGLRRAGFRAATAPV